MKEGITYVVLVDGLRVSYMERHLHGGSSTSKPIPKGAKFTYHLPANCDERQKMYVEWDGNTQVGWIRFDDESQYRPQFHQLEKEQTKHGSIRIMDARSYCCTYERVLEFIEIAKRDFPTLKDENIKVQIYAGDRHKGKMGIEFSAPSDVPSDYKMVDKFDFIA